MIDLALGELAKLIMRLNKESKKTRKEQNLIKKIQDIRDTIQGAVLYAKLKKRWDKERGITCQGTLYILFEFVLFLNMLIYRDLIKDCVVG